MSGDNQLIKRAFGQALVAGVSAAISIPLSIHVGNQIISIASTTRASPFIWMLLSGTIIALTGWFLEAKVTRRVLGYTVLIRYGLEMIGLCFEIMGGLLILGAFAVAGTTHPL